MEVSHESQSKHSMALTCTKTAPSAKFAYLPVENVIGLQESISNQVKILQWGSTTELDMSRRGQSPLESGPPGLPTAE